jgi:hypothetical protein
LSGGAIILDQQYPHTSPPIRPIKGFKNYE